MEEEGIIEGYTVVLNQEKLGRETLAYMLIRTKPGADYTTMMDDITKHEEVEDIAAISGDFDIILKVRTNNMKELDQFIFNYLRKFPDVTQTQTLMVFRGANNMSSVFVGVIIEESLENKNVLKKLRLPKQELSE